MTEIKQIAEIIPEKKNLWVSITGGGGKTTLMQQLAQQFKSQGKTVLMTTTTKIQNTKNYKWMADFLFTDQIEALSFVPERPCVVLYADTCYDVKKLQAPQQHILKVLNQRFDVVLCEADGSRQLPLKIHTDRDPVIVPWNDFTLSVMGSWAIGQSAADWCFGIDTVPCSYDIINVEFIQWYIDLSQGLLKGSEEGKRAIVVTGDCPSEIWEKIYGICKKREIPVFRKDCEINGIIPIVIS